MYKIDASYWKEEMEVYRIKKSDREQPLPDNKPNKLFMKNILKHKC